MTPTGASKIYLALAGFVLILVGIFIDAAIIKFLLLQFLPVVATYLQVAVGVTILRIAQKA